jgi:hypothetical protein
MSYAEQLERLQAMRAQTRALEKQLEREARAMQPITEQDERRMYADQVAFDPAYQAANRRAPPPLPFERPAKYSRRLAAGLQPLSSRWAKADLDGLPDGAFAVAADQIRADAIKAGPTAGLAPGEIREAPSESHGGHKVIEFRGGENSSFIKHFTRPARRAVFADHSAYAAMSRDAQLSRITELARYGQRPIVQAPTPRF